MHSTESNGAEPNKGIKGIKGIKGRSAAGDGARRMRLADADPWLNKGEVAVYRNVSKSTLDRQIARGQFPRGELITASTRGWRLSAVKAAPPAGAVRPQERPT